MNVLLRFDDVALVRGSRMLFEGLDLELSAGEGLHVAGPNGSGKSSLIRLAANLLRAERGTVERVTTALADDHVALDRELPLGRALAFWAADRTRATPALDAWGIADLADVPVRLLSSGQLKRATLARVDASPARLWLLDEPLNALDRDGVERLAARIDAHRKAGGAVLTASHQPLPGEWRRLELSA